MAFKLSHQTGATMGSRDSKKQEAGNQEQFRPNTS